MAKRYAGLYCNDTEDKIKSLSITISQNLTNVKLFAIISLENMAKLRGELTDASDEYAGFYQKSK